METTEKIVEAYVRYVKDWATIPNIKCKGQFEIDLLAIDPVNLNRYHIESSVSISRSFSKLTAKEFSETAYKERVQKPKQRRTIGYFSERKFESEPVMETLKKYGFIHGNYSKVIVTWGWEDDVPAVAEKLNIELWDFKEILKKIADTFQKEKTYFTDDTLRTLQLFSKAIS